MDINYFLLTSCIKFNVMRFYIAHAVEKRPLIKLEIMKRNCRSVIPQIVPRGVGSSYHYGTPRRAHTLEINTVCRNGVFYYLEFCLHQCERFCLLELKILCTRTLASSLRSLSTSS